MPDGSEKPIGYASRTLTNAERNYSQLKKEGLSCIFGIKKFHNSLFGHAFELVTDHKPLLGLLKEDRATSPQASARIKRWSLFLLPLPVQPAKTDLEPELILLAEHLADAPVTADDIRVWTLDPERPQTSKSVGTVYIKASRTLGLRGMHPMGKQDHCSTTRKRSRLRRVARGPSGNDEDESFGHDVRVVAWDQCGY